jgi:hypothetical protein
MNRNNTISSQKSDWNFPTEKPEILIVSSFPPRECGIANYTFDLVKALNKKKLMTRGENATDNVKEKLNDFYERSKHDVDHVKSKVQA